ncbi:MAG: hypothetical protein ACOCSL_01350 [Thermoplasmatota archaeon]
MKAKNKIRRVVSGVTFGMVIAMMLGILAIPQSSVASTPEEGGGGCDFVNASGTAIVEDEGSYFDLDISFNPNAGDDNGGILVAGGNVIEVTQNGPYKVYEFDHALTAEQRVKDANKVDGWLLFYRDYSVDSNEYTDETHKYTEGNEVHIESTYEWDGGYVEKSAFGDKPVDEGGSYTATFTGKI